MIDIGTRRHGPFDTRYPRPLTGVADPDFEQPGDRDPVESWEWEGGQVGSRTRAGSHENGHRRSGAEALPDGLSWERFCALTHPGMKRHYFPAIAAWYRYRDGDRSWPHPDDPS